MDGSRCGWVDHSQMIFTVLLVFAVGIADGVHVMSAHFSFRRQGDDHCDVQPTARQARHRGDNDHHHGRRSGPDHFELVPIQVFGMMSAFGRDGFFTLVLLPTLISGTRCSGSG